MDPQVDILVRSKATSRPELVVAVKLSGDLSTATAQLARYMSGVGAPVGLMVVGDTMRILRDNYSAVGPSSVEVVSEFSTRGIDALAVPPRSGSNAALDFEAAVQTWLESLVDLSQVIALPAAVRAAVAEHLVPVVESGVVTAAGPRARLTAHG